MQDASGQGKIYSHRKLGFTGQGNIYSHRKPGLTCSESHVALRLPREWGSTQLDILLCQATRLRSGQNRASGSGSHTNVSNLKCHAPHTYGLRQSSHGLQTGYTLQLGDPPSSSCKEAGNQEQPSKPTNITGQNSMKKFGHHWTCPVSSKHVYTGILDGLPYR